MTLPKVYRNPNATLSFKLNQIKALLTDMKVELRNGRDILESEYDSYRKQILKIESTVDSLYVETSTNTQKQITQSEDII